MSDQLQLRRDMLANIQVAVPAEGEPAFATDTGQLFIGDGATAGGMLIAPSLAFIGYKSGRYYTAGSLGNSTFTVAANTLYAVPFYALSRVTFTTLSVDVTVGAAGSSGRIGVYTNAAGTVAPGALVAGSDSGSFSTASAGVQEVAGLSFTLTIGMYWFAALFSGTPGIGSSNGWGVSIPATYGMSSLTSTQNDLGYAASQSFGAMPASFPAGAFVNVAGQLPLIAARL